MQKHDIDVAEARPDITHQCLLALMDSPLNKAGLLQVYIHTKKNVLIEINPKTRIPRTFKRFSGLIVQLLHKLHIRSQEGSETLLRVIKNPVTNYFPPNSRKISTSVSANCVNLSEFVPTFPANEPVVFVVGAFSQGKVDVDYADEEIAISQYPLSGAVACGKICNAFESQWDIL